MGPNCQQPAGSAARRGQDYLGGLQLGQLAGAPRCGIRGVNSDAWRENTLIGVSQVANTITIVSFSNSGSDRNTSQEQVTYTLGTPRRASDHAVVPLPGPPGRFKATILFPPRIVWRDVLASLKRGDRLRG